MKIATLHLKSLSPYNQSRQHFVPRADDGKETHEDHEARTWMERGHYNQDGEAYVPPMAIKGCIASAAKMLSISIPGQGKSKYTKHFLSGVMCADEMLLGVKKKDVQPQWVSCSGTGTKGQMGVLRAFVHFPSWEGNVAVHVLDDTITKEVFTRVVKEAGSFVGIGQFRPQTGGYFGRFEVLGIAWS